MAGTHGPVTAWRRWGPYPSERSWGTVREDYSADGNAWDYFPHDHARSRAYRWGEDGLAAICDRYQILCFALALWNERDPILKERLFGVVPAEGNHGEDVKEYYFYLDSTPSHSYMKWLYKYPQREYPYQRLVEENQRRGGRGPEFELLDTRHLRRRPLLRRLRGVREGRARGHGHPRHHPQPRAGGGAHPGAAAPVVPQHVGLGTAAAARADDRGGGDERGAQRPAWPTTRTRSPSATCPFLYRLGPRRLMRARGRRAAVHEQRDAHAAALRSAGAEPRRPTSRTRSTATS